MSEQIRRVNLIHDLYEKNFERLLNCSDKDRPRFTKVENWLNERSIKAKEDIGIYDKNPCNIKNNIGHCDDCTGYFKLVQKGRNFIGIMSDSGHRCDYKKMLYMKKENWWTRD